MTENKQRNINICNHQNTTSSNGDIVCSDCGLVLEKVIVGDTYIPTIKSQNQDYKRRDISVSFGDSSSFMGGLGSQVGYSRSRFITDPHGHYIKPNNLKLFKRLIKHNRNAAAHGRDQLYRSLRVLTNVSKSLKISYNVREQAGFFFRQVLKFEEKKIINQITLLATSIIYAIRTDRQKSPIPLKDVCNAFSELGHGVTPRLITRDLLLYKKHFTIKSSHKRSEEYIVSLIDKILSLKDLSKRLNLKKINWNKEGLRTKLENKSFWILNNLSIVKRGGRNPFILAGAVIYTASLLLNRENNFKKVLTQKIIANQTNIVEYTLRTHFIFLKEIFIKNEKRA